MVVQSIGAVPASESQANDFSFRRNFQDIFNQHPNNTLLLKISYWINP